MKLYRYCSDKKEDKYDYRFYLIVEDNYCIFMCDDELNRCEKNFYRGFNSSITLNFCDQVNIAEQKTFYQRIL